MCAQIKICKNVQIEKKKIDKSQLFNAKSANKPAKSVSAAVAALVNFSALQSCVCQSSARSTLLIVKKNGRVGETFTLRNVSMMKGFELNI